MTEAEHEWTAEVVRNVWTRVNTGALYNWPEKAGGQQRILADLHSIFPDLPSHIFRESDKGRLNRLLREQLAGLLIHSDQPRSALANWIVRRWGGIKFQEHTLDSYLADLDDFSKSAVDTFIAARQTKHISSWSKVLAFADPSRYAIYDSRTAVALNCGLEKAGDPRRFEIPQSRAYEPRIPRSTLNHGQMMRKVRPLLSIPQLDPNWRAYASYLMFLRVVVKEGLSSDLLDAEMVLFANAPNLVRERLKDSADR